MPARISDIRTLRILARLRRVNAPPSARDELDAMRPMPPSLRLHVPVPELVRDVLKALRAELVAAPGEVERHGRREGTRRGAG